MSITLATPPTAALTFRDLDLGYDQTPVVQGLNASIARSSLTALVGPNGAGKSTLLRGIIGELRPLRGQIDLGGSTPEEIAYLTQDPQLEPSIPVRVFDVVAMGLWRELGSFRGMGAAHVARVTEVLRRVGLTGYEQHPASGLSTGQLRRALFARMLLQDADVLLLDEPLATIDAATAADLWELIRRLHRDGKTVVVVMHDIAVVRADCTAVILLANELIAQGSPAEALTDSNLQRAWQGRPRVGAASGLADTGPDSCELPRAA